MKTPHLLITLLLVVLILFLSFFLLQRFYGTLDQREAAFGVDRALDFCEDQLQEEKQMALSLAILLAEKPVIARSLREGDRMAAFSTVQGVLRKLEQNRIAGDMDVQVVTADLRAFVRSWDYEDYNTPLSGFRYGLVEVKKSLHPFVGVELGKRLNIKAIAPVTENGEFLGTVEALLGLERLSRRVSRQGIRLFVLMESSYLETAEYLRDAPKVFSYVLVNHKGADPKVMDVLERYPEPDRWRDGIAWEQEGWAFGTRPLIGVSGRRLGVLLVGLDVGSDLMLKTEESVPGKGIGPVNQREVEIQ